MPSCLTIRYTPGMEESTRNGCLVTVIVVGVMFLSLFLYLVWEFIVDWYRYGPPRLG